MGLPRLNTTLALVTWAWWACCSIACGGTPQDAAPYAPSPSSASFALNTSEGDCAASAIFDPSDRVETYDSRAGDFRVHFTRSGRNAVPRPDADGDGTPDYVRQVADDFDAVLAFYRELGYRMPLHAGEDRFSVYLVDFPTTADGQYCRTSCDADGCSGHMLLENDFVGRRYASTDAAIRLLASHELFHGVQAAYTEHASLVLSEGTAVWASEQFDSTAGDLESQAPGYLRQPELPLGQDPAGNFDTFSYGSSLFFEYLSEAEDRTVIRELWAALANGTDAQPEPDSWPAALDEVLQARGTSLAASFAQFAEWNLFTGPRADDRAYASGAMFPAVTEVSVDGFTYEKSVRVYPLAARYYALSSDQDQTLFAKADLPEGADATGLELLVAREHDGQIADLQHADPAGHMAQQELMRGDTFHVVVFNTRHAGESVRPSLCIGAVSELSKCGASTAPDAGVGVNAGGAAEAPHDANSGCSVSRPRTGVYGLTAGFTLLVALASLRSRRRRHMSLRVIPRSQPTET